MGRVRHMYDVGIAVGNGGRLRMQYEWYRKQSLMAVLSSLKLQVFIWWEEKRFRRLDRKRLSKRYQNTP